MGKTSFLGTLADGCLEEKGSFSASMYKGSLFLKSVELCLSLQWVFKKKTGSLQLEETSFLCNLRKISCHLKLFYAFQFTTGCYKKFPSVTRSTSKTQSGLSRCLPHAVVMARISWVTVSKHLSCIIHTDFVSIHINVPISM